MTGRSVGNLAKSLIGFAALSLCSCAEKGVQVLADAPELKGFKDEFKYGWIKYCFANENKFFPDRLKKVNRIRMKIEIGEMDLYRANLYPRGRGSFYIVFKNYGDFESQYKRRDYIFFEKVKKYAAQIRWKRDGLRNEYGRFDADVTGIIYRDIVQCGIGDGAGYYDGIIFIEKMEI